MATRGWITLGGIQNNTKRGKLKLALKACIFTWLLCIMKPNAAELHRIYLHMKIGMAAKVDKIINTKGLLTCICKMNDYLGLMHCLKDIEDAPDALKRADVLFKAPYRTHLCVCTGPKRSQIIFQKTHNCW